MNAECHDDCNVVAKKLQLDCPHPPPAREFFFLTMLRQHSQYDSRLGFSFRVLVRVMVRVRLWLG